MILEDLFKPKLCLISIIYLKSTPKITILYRGSAFVYQFSDLVRVLYQKCGRQLFVLILSATTFTAYSKSESYFEAMLLSFQSSSVTSNHHF